MPLEMIKSFLFICSYHGQEDTKLWVHVDNVSVREDELRFAFLLAGQHDVDLLGGYREHGQLNTVELIEAAPAAGLGKTYIIKQ